MTSLRWFPAQIAVTLVALSADSGDPLWSNEFGGKGFSRRLGPFIIDRAIWSLDPAAGVVAVRRPDNGELLREVQGFF